MTSPAHRVLSWDGAELSLEPSFGRQLRIDRRCLEGDVCAGSYAHVCALPDGQARTPFDQAEVQQVRRDALAWWIPLLGDSLVCLSLFSVDAVHCAGAVTVTTQPDFFDHDPFARLFPGTVVRSDLFSTVDAPAGPVTERTAGAPWPGGRFRRSDKA